MAFSKAENTIDKVKTDLTNAVIDNVSFPAMIGGIQLLDGPTTLMKAIIDDDGLDRSKLQGQLTFLTEL